MTAPPPPALEARSLGWSTRGARILADVSFQLHPGERLGLIGPNGSGKSTLLRLLAGLARPTSGQALLEGRDIARIPRHQIARRLAFVEQQAETGERLTVRDAVELGRTPWLSAISPRTDEDAVIVTRALRDVDMLHMADRDWDTLSGGERQRTHIARALAQRPGILLLDEPGNHLDIHHQLSILDLIAGLRVTTVIALHDINQAMGCDRVAVLQAGRLVAHGPPAQVVTPDLLARVFAISARFLTDPADGARIIRFLSQN